MIELRWREVFVQLAQDYGRVEKVLQYRERSNPEEIGLHPPIWREWQDVPTKAQG